MQEIHQAPSRRKIEIPISEKYMLTINEAAAYFSIMILRTLFLHKMIFQILW